MLTQLMASNDVFQEVGQSGLYVTVTSEDIITPDVLSFSFDKPLYLPGDYECSVVNFYRPSIIYINNGSYVAIMKWTETGWTSTPKYLVLNEIHTLKQLVDTTNNFFISFNAASPPIITFNWKTRHLEIKTYTVGSETYTVCFNSDLMLKLGLVTNADQNEVLSSTQPYEENDLCVIECDMTVPRTLRVLKGQTHNMLNPLYVPIQKTLIPHITLRLFDIKANPLNIQPGHCVAVLHIRPRHG